MLLIHVLSYFQGFVLQRVEGLFLTSNGVQTASAQMTTRSAHARTSTLKGRNVEYIPRTQFLARRLGGHRPCLNGARKGN